MFHYSYPDIHTHNFRLHSGQGFPKHLLSKDWPSNLQLKNIRKMLSNYEFQTLSLAPSLPPTPPDIDERWPVGHGCASVLHLRLDRLQVLGELRQEAGPVRHTPAHRLVLLPAVNQSIQPSTTISQETKKSVYQSSNQRMYE